MVYSGTYLQLEWQCILSFPFFLSFHPSMYPSTHSSITQMHTLSPPSGWSIFRTAESLEFRPCEASVASHSTWLKPQTLLWEVSIGIGSIRLSVYVLYCVRHSRTAMLNAPTVCLELLPTLEIFDWESYSSNTELQTVLDAVSSVCELVWMGRKSW